MSAVVDAGLATVAVVTVIWLIVLTNRYLELKGNVGRTREALGNDLQAHTEEHHVRPWLPAPWPSAWDGKTPKAWEEAWDEATIQPEVLDDPPRGRRIATPNRPDPFLPGEKLDPRPICERCKRPCYRRGDPLERSYWQEVDTSGRAKVWHHECWNAEVIDRETTAGLRSPTSSGELMQVPNPAPAPPQPEDTATSGTEHDA